MFELVPIHISDICGGASGPVIFHWYDLYCSFYGFLKDI